ncbi:hypothetical protein FISHEDRAFT_59542 [Fistulina hepatica ATCC 64428]|uniref:BTB domain-containing protein n=1 Tax=Fistulina hepatica ATCC 64428 TaxID=1128425 RepID=A0A0D7A9R3_9AGAR|nr:hypothetical protein FISHEDRAFT_59542 [Fistulina hepatica ATCC 64428]
MSGKVTWNVRPQASYVVYETREEPSIEHAGDLSCVDFERAPCGPAAKEEVRVNLPVRQELSPCRETKVAVLCEVADKHIELRASDGTCFKVKEEELKRSCEKVPCFDDQAARHIPLPADHLRILLQFAKVPAMRRHPLFHGDHFSKMIDMARVAQQWTMWGATMFFEQSLLNVLPKDEAFYESMNSIVGGGSDTFRERFITTVRFVLLEGFGSAEFRHWVLCATLPIDTQIMRSILNDDERYFNWSAERDSMINRYAGGYCECGKTHANTWFGLRIFCKEQAELGAMNLNLAALEVAS